MKKYKVIIVGSGFGGQTAAFNLIKKGINDFVILERRDFIGGTWCQNTYPGAAVDVQSLLYSLSFVPYKWTRMFATQSELKDYTLFAINKFKLQEKIQLNATVISATWQETEQYWSIQLQNGETYHAQFIINASGPLSFPTTPDIPGKDSFQGAAFHTNKWNHEFDYSNKKVAIIGSGASAIQIIPAIADDVEQLHIFQRTPHWVLPKHDFKFPKFLQWLLSFSIVYKLARYITYWLLESRVIAFKYSKTARYFFAQRKALKFLKKSFSDPNFRKKVTPDFSIGCKRILLSNTLYKTYLKKNVSLHTKENGIKAIFENGIELADGSKVDLDLIVYATGYDPERGIVSYPVIGRNKHLMSDFWKEYPRAYLGTVVPDFPNFFIITGPNTGIGHTSAIVVIEAQMKYILKATQSVDRKNKQAIDVTPQAESDYTKMIHREMKKTVWQSGGCNSWYQTKSGHVVAMFPGFTFSYYFLANNFKEKDHKYS